MMSPRDVTIVCSIILVREPLQHAQMICHGSSVLLKASMPINNIN